MDFKNKTKLLLSAAIIFSFLFSLKLKAEANYLFDWNAGAGTIWSDWTWFPTGADDFGSIGWRKDDGQFYSGSSNWLPRVFEKSDYGNQTSGEIVTDDLSPSSSMGGSLHIYDTNPDGASIGSIASGSNLLTVTEPEKFTVGERIAMPGVPLFAGGVNPIAKIGTINGNIFSIVHQSSGDPINADATVVDGAVNPVWRSSWWYIFGKNFGTSGTANATTNRLDFYFKFNSSVTTNAGLDIGTYLCWPGGAVDGSDCPKEADGPSGGRFNQAGQHYYHQMYVTPGTWLHLQLDQRPSHARQASGAGEPDNDPMLEEMGKHYFENMNSFYIETKDNSLTPTEYWIDEMKLWTQTQPENELSISNVWVGYWEATDKWEIGFQDNSFNSVGYNDYSNSVFEVRYSTAPITNENYDSATVIVPEINKVGAENLMRRSSSWTKSTQTNFAISDAIEQNNNTIYFAIKDMSVAGQHVGSWPYIHGDGHDAPSSNIKTIDYALRPSVTQVRRGDVDNNSTTNTTDALLTLRNSLSLSMTTTAWQTGATTGDVDCNGFSNSTDALLILRYSLGLGMESTAWCE